MKKKIVMVSSIALASFLIIGQFVYAEKPDNMMNGNGIKKMMESIKSPEGQKMVKDCGDFMESKNNGEVK